ncbi:hypothetical protein BC939DRAFT_286105 [Gamsiella multidivaricata]|uniref:uncharacterized protein n=1 Tax=Gamsiella multidivaricata TaxID=101098 RepID=UPI00221E58A1|nr:uncharacterized protein BC939DRAFT_286105 [Gamsiella multidivaricata]KAI7830544.1 hypothetical protein BC939DRAFT_286105 [Gamsiella multidivaricata]
MPSETETSRGSLSPSATSGLRAASASGPWRPASLAGRNSPALTHASTFKDHGDHHSGMAPLRSHSSGTPSSDRHRPQLVSSSASTSSLSSSPGGSAWQSPTKRTVVANSNYAPPSNSSLGAERNNGGEHHHTSASPVLGSFSSFARSSFASTPALSSSSTSTGPTVPSIVAGISPSTGPGAGSGAGTPSSMASAQKQPLNLEALAAKFADPKENKEKFAKLQLSPALAPTSLADKERRTPMGSFVAPSPSSSHIAHIKVQRTASLNHSSHSSLLSKGSSSRLQPGHFTQTTDMRRTASHNNAFSSGLGMPLGSNRERDGHDQNGVAGSGGSSYSNGTSGHHGGLGGTLGSSSQLAPFSLSQMTRPPRRPSLNPPDQNSLNQQDHVSPMHTSHTSHPLQHAWTLYYDTSAGYNRQSSSLHNYENGLRDLGTFTTVELFARYFNWIEKPHKMENNSNYHLFKDGIKPMWEDPANANGGRWIVTLLDKNSELLDRCWMELAYALVGEQLDAGDDICGAVLSRRTRADRLAVWVRDKENVEVINGIGYILRHDQLYNSCAHHFLWLSL